MSIENQLLIISFQAVQVTFCVAFLHGFTFVVIFLTAAQPDLEFCDAFFVSEQTQRNYGKPFILNAFLEAFKLFFVQEELALAFWGMAKAAAVGIFLDICVDGKQLVVLELTEALGYGSLPQTDGFDLAPGQYNTGCVALKYLIIKACPFVKYVYRFLHKDCKGKHYTSMPQLLFKSLLYFP